MSYRPEEQALEPHVDQICNGILAFRNAAIARFRSRDWKREHLEELEELLLDLTSVECKLLQLKEDTW